jgi:hypothetical protein
MAATNTHDNQERAATIQQPRGEQRRTYAMSHKSEYAYFQVIRTSANNRAIVVLPSHGRGRWFEPSIAHSEKEATNKE